MGRMLQALGMARCIVEQRGCLLLSCIVRALAGVMSNQHLLICFMPSCSTLSHSCCIWLAVQEGQAGGKRTRLVAQSSRLSYATHWSKKVAI